MFSWIVDILATRYGWTNRYLEEELYWEEVWNLVQMAANFSAEEKNAEYKFHFMLHADEKAAAKWKDLPLPFGRAGDKDTFLRDALHDSGGTGQLGLLAPHIPVSHLPTKKIVKIPSK